MAVRRRSARQGQGHRFQTGYLDALERDDSAAMGRARFEEVRQRAIAHGFTERQAPFAAMAVLLRGQANLGAIRSHLQSTHPELFEESA